MSGIILNGGGSVTHAVRLGSELGSTYCRSELGTICSKLADR
jgi:hypothetical protein